MKNLSQAFDFQKFLHNPRLDAITHDVESRYDKTALSDDDLELVSAAGEAEIPVMQPEVLMGRFEMSDDTKGNKP